MLVTVDTSLTSTSPQTSQPVAVERYDDETREFYDTERPDRLNFRIVDSKKDHRFYHPGRLDLVKEAIFDTTTRNEIDILFHTGRQDSMVRYQRFASLVDEKTNDVVNVTHKVVYGTEGRNSREDGLRSVALTLRAHQSIDIKQDSAATLFGHKTLHLALTCDPDGNAGHVLEVYQDQLSRVLRLTVEDQLTMLPKVFSFPNDEPNDHPLYEANKILLMEALVKVLAVEREVFLNMPRIVDVAEQKKRLEELSLGLFGALDAASPQPKI